MMKRRLAAVLMADICGYARMVSQLEETTVSRMLEMRSRIIEPLVLAHGGRVMDYAGDGALIEFDQAPRAMMCGIAIHFELARRERSVRLEYQFRLRIGIDFGVVLAHDSGIAGQHVNIASRLEALAPPGGICLSGRARANVGTKLAKRCRMGGTHSLRHISEPVELWFWVPQVDCPRRRRFFRLKALDRRQESSQSTAAESARGGEIDLALWREKPRIHVIPNMA